ncbi:MAG: hypothetical protein J6M62_05295 [Selenomonadaceae bacterium]|nr:hypothetical protein [Selenomonadaceae bacterium]
MYALEWDEDEAREAWAEEREEAIMEARKKAREEAQKEARKEAKKAKEDGIREGITSMITELLKAGQSVEFISKISKFPKEKVLELGKMHNIL